MRRLTEGIGLAHGFDRGFFVLFFLISVLGQLLRVQRICQVTLLTRTVVPLQNFSLLDSRCLHGDVLIV